MKRSRSKSKWKKNVSSFNRASHAYNRQFVRHAYVQCQGLSQRSKPQNPKTPKPQKPGKTETHKDWHFLNISIPVFSIYQTKAVYFKRINPKCLQSQQIHTIYISQHLNKNITHKQHDTITLHTKSQGQQTKIRYNSFLAKLTPNI